MSRDELAELGIERPEAIEHQDVSPTGVTVFLTVLFISLGLVLVFLWWLYGAFSATRRAEQPFPLPKLSQMPPQPRIQAAPLIDMWQLRTHEDTILNTYGWIDRQGGTVRIPISRTMDLIAARGLPVQSGAAPAPTVPETGPESGGPQTGTAVPRFNRPPGMETSPRQP
jgi:hypothetical protein